MSFLHKKRLLVTGGAGFLGTEVCRELQGYAPAEIIIPRSRHYDLRQPRVAGELMRKERPDVVIHLAAVVGGIGANIENPGKYFYENAVMAVHLMEEARLAGVRKFLSVGTICSYPKHTPVPFKEQDLWNGYPEETNAPYGLAKKMLLVQGQAYHQQYGFNAITLLPVNLYGPGDNFDPRSSHVIPALIRKVLEAVDDGRDQIDAWGTGSATREFLFVRDAARAIGLAAEKYDEPEPVNVGAGKEISIRQLVQLICELCGFEGQIIWDRSKPDGQPRRCVDTSRSWSAFGFQATTSLRDGLIETISWYERHRQEIVNGELHGNGATSKPAETSLPASATSTFSSHQQAKTSAGIDTSVDTQPDDDARGNSSIRRALITGISGQDGSYLAELLLAKGYEVHGIVRRNSSIESNWRLDDIYQDPHDSHRRLYLHYGDVTDANCITSLVLDVEPDEIYNLAAQSHVRVSFDNPMYTTNVVAAGVVSVLEASRLLSKRKDVRFYQASSSEMFGGDPRTAPQSEATPFHPRSPYGCAKVFAHHQTVNYREAYDLFGCCGILFNHESPRRGETFVTRKITRAAARIAAGLQDKLYLGNLEARRDWGYAKDYVEAMWLMLQQDEPEDYVIATGETHSVEQFLSLAFECIDRDWHDHVDIDTRYFRPSEVDVLCGDASKAHDKLKWQPSVTLDELVRIMVEADSQQAQEERAYQFVRASR